ncbi:MAG: ferrous iron transport protein B [bacterium]|nr:ferrous iron transport protein B [bacterium]
MTKMTNPHHKPLPHTKRLSTDTQLPRILLIGNPNVGKSVIFGLLTGKYVTVSNYPGTSVEITIGRVKIENQWFELLDTPGVNSLLPRSEDERVTRDIVLEKPPYGVVQVIDAKNLMRGLQLTHQLIEYQLPLIVVLNMWDEAEERHIQIDVQGLQKKLGVPVIPTTATLHFGISELKQAWQNFRKPTLKLEFHPLIEQTVEKISKHLPIHPSLQRGVALSILSGDQTILEQLNIPNSTAIQNEIQQHILALKERFYEPLSFLLSRSRKQNVNELFGIYYSSPTRTIPVWREKIGNWMMHPIWGVPFLLLVLFFMYQWVGVWAAGDVVDWIENSIFGGIDPETQKTTGYINPFFIQRLEPLKQYGALGNGLVDFLVGKYGVITLGITYAIAIVLPVIFFFFIAFGILEDSGYLPRLTILSNRIFKKIGLNGKAVLPMVLGLGCDTMATFTTRTLETRKERMIAILLLALGVPCSAQLGVILGMASATHPKVLLIVFGTVALQLLLVGWSANRVLRGKVSSFLMEIPPIRIPRLKNLVIKTVFRVKWFLLEAVPLFVIGTVVLFLVDKLGILSGIERMAQPILRNLLSLPNETAQAFILGFLRRDYGAAGLFMLEKEGFLDLIQTTVSLTVMVLFIPCLASFLAIVKEQGLKHALLIASFISGYAILVGAGLNLVLRNFQILP